jgi:DNA-binding transcriptional LysR family regulator
VAAPALLGKTASFQDKLLQQHPVVTLPVGAGTTRLLDEWLIARNIDIAHRLICTREGAIAGLLTEGIGIGFLPES